MKNILTGKKKRKPELPEDYIASFIKKNENIQVLIEKFELEINY